MNCRRKTGKQIFEGISLLKRSCNHKKIYHFKNPISSQFYTMCLAIDVFTPFLEIVEKGKASVSDAVNSP